MMSDFIWRIIYKNVDWKDWKVINRLYHTKGTATGVLKRRREVIWDDKNKVWHTLDGKLVFRLQSTKLKWEDYESK